MKVNLLFMALDVGEHAAGCGSVHNSDSEAAIAIETHSGSGKRWAYLLSFSSVPPRSDTRYVAYDPLTDSVSTPAYRFGFGRSFPHFFSLGKETDNLLSWSEPRPWLRPNRLGRGQPRSSHHAASAVCPARFSTRAGTGTSPYNRKTAPNNCSAV